MNSTSMPPEDSAKTTHFSGDKLNESSATESGTSLKARLGDYLDDQTRESLQASGASGAPIRDLATRHALPLAIGLGGLALLSAWLVRRSRQSRSPWS